MNKTAKEKFRARIVFEIDPELKQEFDKIMEHGDRALILRNLIQQIVSLTKKSGHIVTAAICSGKLGIGFNNLEELVNELKRLSEGFQLNDKGRAEGGDDEDKSGTSLPTTSQGSQAKEGANK